MTDIHTYLFTMLLGVWLTINFVLKVNRARDKCQAVIEGREPAPGSQDPAPAAALDEPVSAGMRPAKSDDDKKND